MPASRKVTLSETQRDELEELRDHSPKAYLRECAAGILKVAAGWSVRQVAEYGLLRRHEPETVSGWIERYEQAGIEGLKVKAGRGRKPLFFPSKPERSQGST